MVAALMQPPFSMDLLQFQQNITGINVWEIYKPILEKYFANIEQSVRDQLSEGISGDGQPMPDYKNESYADFKVHAVATYKIYPTTDLRLTGAFYDGIKAKFDLLGIEIESLDSKAKELEKKYGSSIYELTDESIKKLIDTTVGELQESLLNAMLYE